MSRILVPLDGSDFAEKALEPAISLAKSYQASIVLYGCLSLEEAGIELSPLTFADSWTEKKDNLVEFLEGVLVKVRNAGIEAQMSWSPGRPVDQIVKTSQEENCDCIVMASHGRSGIERLFLGSVAEGVLRRSSCPVFLIRCSED